MEVAGVDGCPGGWVVVRVDAAGRLRVAETFVAASIVELLARTRDCQTVGIDVPIGLCDSEPRQADIAARRVIGARRNSVFPAPVRPVLNAKSYVEACTVSEQACGKKLSKQAFAILPKIRESDQAMLVDTTLQEWMFEVHPEVCFWALNGHEPLRHYKKSPEGDGERTALLASVFTSDVADLTAPRGAARDDVLDACAAAWTARRFATGQHQTLPEVPPVDSRGLRMEIVY
jgi:predicted RNase H-like nuclease